MCLSANGQHLVVESFFGNVGVRLDLGCVNVMCVSVFVSSCMREEIKIEAAHWVQAHSYA